MSFAPLEPNQILSDLGIRDPRDLDIEAIAEYCHATVRYRPLTGHEARILGYRDRAIITVNSLSSRGRQRFSAAHELGHWMRDRGQIAFQCQSAHFTKNWVTSNPETRANRFASDLLMPVQMFRPYARNNPVTFQTVKELASKFETSLTATAIRLVEHGWLPCMLIFIADQRTDWFVASSGVSGRFWPMDQPGLRTLAHALQFGRNLAGPLDVRCSEWINHPLADRYWIKEDSIVLRGRGVLSLLWWEDDTQIIDQEEYEERRDSARSDRREE